MITGLAAGPCVLAGHSWGGILVQLLAFRRPDLAAGLVLVDPGHEVAVLDDLRCSAGDSQRPEAQELPGDRQRPAGVRAGQELAGRERDHGAR
jgi:pimeloyl-ACP methyl ester carboxylesterase